jgi:hypothetical protein
MNKRQTKYIIAARNEKTIRDVGQSVVIGDKHFEVVKEFLYLRSLMTPTNDVSLDIQRRIQTAKRCFFGLCKYLQSSHLARQTKFTIHNTLIRSVLLYGSETWVLTKREENQLLREEGSPNDIRYTASTGEGTTMNSIKSLTAQMPYMSRRQAECATLVTCTEYLKTYQKELYSEPSPMEGEIKEDRNSGGRMG